MVMNYYPERLGHCIMYKGPAVFGIFFNATHHHHPKPPVSRKILHSPIACALHMYANKSLHISRSGTSEIRLQTPAPPLHLTYSLPPSAAASSSPARCRARPPQYQVLIRLLIFVTDLTFWDRVADVGIAHIPERLYRIHQIQLLRDQLELAYTQKDPPRRVSMTEMSFRVIQTLSHR